MARHLEVAVAGDLPARTMVSARRGARRRTRTSVRFREVGQRPQLTHHVRLCPMPFMLRDDFHFNSPVSRMLAAAGCAALLGACAAGDMDPMGDPGDPEAERAAIDGFVRGLEPLAVAPPERVEGEPFEPVREGEYSCTTQELSETRQYDRIVAYGANSESMWPGALLRGDSLYTGEFTQVVAPRAPLTFSISLENLGGARSAELPEPSLSSFREAIGTILSAEVTGDTPANIFSEIEQVHSEEQLTLAMGAGVSAIGLPAQIKTSFNFADQQTRSRYLVKYIQSYYTVDIDQPSSPSAVFADGVSLEDVSAQFGPLNPPVYVSSITYGRMILFTFESQYSAEELGAALEFAYKGGADVSGNVSVTYKEIVSNANITAYILGGSAGDAAQSIDSYEGLIEFIKSGGNYSRQSPGAPIAYKLSYLADNAPARMSYSNEYQLKECVRVSQKVKVTLDSITAEATGDDIDGTVELHGTIRASATTEATLFSRDTSALLQVARDETLPLAQEALIEVEPQPGNAILIAFDLFENDPISADTLPHTEFVADYETGWRRTKDVLIIAGDTRIKVTVSLEPI
jgi:thiol-activated cytolysin